MSRLLEHSLAAIHMLSAAAWLGALVYRVFFVDRKATKFFQRESEYERYSLDLAHGMRYVVMAALIACGLSGFVMAGLRWNASESWLSIMVAKTVLWMIASALFAYISWVFWPRRVFADASEWPGLRRQGLLLSLVMIGIAALGMVLGQIAQTLAIAPAESQ
jgi:uncharacterized membrane protein